VYHSLSELRASPRHVLASVPLSYSCSPHGTRLRGRCDASAKSKTASTVLAHEVLSILPLPSSPGSPNRIETLLNSSPTLLRGSFLRLPNRGQSINTWLKPREKVDNSHIFISFSHSSQQKPNWDGPQPWYPRGIGANTFFRQVNNSLLILLTPSPHLKSIRVS
jgi:hypothetical protein